MNYDNIDLEKIYDYNEFPDKKAGRCDNCDSSHFQSTIRDGAFIRQCRKCEMKKLI